MQATEMLNNTEQLAVEQELADLWQRYSLRLQSLEELRQAEALQRCGEEEAEESKESERPKQERATTHGRRWTQGSNMANDESSEVLEITGLRTGEELSAEDERDLEPDSLPALPKEYVLDAASACAALEAFIVEILTPFKPKLFLSGQKATNSWLEFQ